MPDEVTNTSSNEVKTTSDGTVKISVEKYNELLETVAKQKEQLTQLRNEPPVINRTEVIKTPEMLASEYRMWGGSLMGLGGSLFIVGAFLYKAGRSKS
jgi:hypothetical protein